MQVHSRLTHPSIATRILYVSASASYTFWGLRFCLLHECDAQWLWPVGTSGSPKVRTRHGDELISYNATKDESMCYHLRCWLAPGPWDALTNDITCFPSSTWPLDSNTFLQSYSHVCTWYLFVFEKTNNSPSYASYIITREPYSRCCESSSREHLSLWISKRWSTYIWSIFFPDPGWSPSSFSGSTPPSQVEPSLDLWGLVVSLWLVSLWW